MIKWIFLVILEMSRSQEHRGFYGTVWLTEETLKAVLFDVCNSLKEKARNIFITSFHANEPYVNDFIENNQFTGVKIVYLEMFNKKDDENIERKIIKGRLDDHAGNSEISNLLFLKEALVEVPTKEYKKMKVEDPFETDNLIEKCPDGIADNHLEWVVSKEVGSKILDVYVKRISLNLKQHFKK